MAAQYELVYFAINGRAGGIRLMLDYLKVPFKDTQITDEDWPKFKDSCLFKQIPVLNVNGTHQIAQTATIYRYLAAKHGLLADTLEDQALCDSFGEEISELCIKGRAAIKSMLQQEDEATQKATMAECRRFYDQVFVPAVNKQFKKNGGDFIVGKKLTWLDFILADITDMIPFILGDQTNNELYATIKAHRDRIFALPGLEARLKERAELFKNVVYRGDSKNYEP